MKEYELSRKERNNLKLAVMLANMLTVSAGCTGPEYRVEVGYEDCDIDIYVIDYPAREPIADDMLEQIVSAEEPEDVLKLVREMVNSYPRAFCLC